MILKGLELTLVGMSVVIFMLTLLVFIMNAAYRGILILNRFFPEKDPAQPAAKGAGSLEYEIAAAIAAVKAYQKQKGDR